MKAKESDDQFTPAEIAQRRDTLLFQLLKTPPKPRAAPKAKRKPSRAKGASRKARTVA